MTAEMGNLLFKALMALLFVISAYVSYRSFRHAGPKIKLGKVILGLTLLTLTLSIIVSLRGGNGYVSLISIATAAFLEISLLSGVFIGSIVGISTRGWKSGNKSQKSKVVIIWSLILLSGVVYVALWQQRQSYQHKNRVKSELALEFVKNNSAVIQKVGGNVVPRLTSPILPKEVVPGDDRPLPIGYVISIDRNLYAIVSTSQSAEDHYFTLDCITILSDKERSGNRNPCEK